MNRRRVDAYVGSKPLELRLLLAAEWARLKLNKLQVERMFRGGTRE